MNQSTEMTGLGPLDKLSQALHSRSYGVLCVLYGTGGFVAALARIIGGQAPFGVALLAAVPFRFTLPATLGVVLGYLVGGGMTEGYPFVGAALLLTVARWVLGPKRWEKRRSWLAPALAAALVFLTGVAPFLYRSPLIYDLVLWSTQVVMAGASAAFLERGMDLLERGGRCRDRLDDTALALLAALALLGLDAAAVGGVSLGRIAASVAVLFAAHSGGERAATLTGVICGFVIGFSTGNFTLYVTAYGLGGLLAGIFSSFGRVGSAMAYTLAWGGVSMLADGGVWGFFAVALAAVIFLMIPYSALRMGTRILALHPVNEETVRAVVRDRLQEVGESLQDVSQTTRDVAKRLSESAAGDPPKFYDRVAQTVCRDCPRCPDCWVDRYDATVDIMTHAADQMRRGELLTGEDFGPAFRACDRKSQVAQALNREFRLWNTRQTTRVRAQRMRGLMTDQFDGLSLTLEGVAQEVQQIASGDRVLAAKLEEIFHDARLEPQEVICWRGIEGRLTCSVTIPRYKMTRVQSQELVPRLEEASGVRFSYPVLRENQGQCQYLFYERPAFSAETGSHQIAYAGNKLCGDTFRVVTTQGGFAHIILSDGMGTGNAAAVDSALATALLTRLLEAGVNYEGALKLMNSALLVKSGEESLATLDAARVDLYTGGVRFYKAGAAPTLVLKEGRGVQVDAVSLPAGILSGVEFEESSLTLVEGDMVVMVSDGAVTEGCDWILKMMEENAGENLDKLCQRIANSARLRRSDGREDDITVVAFRLSRND